MTDERRQLDLFGEPPPRPRARPVGPAAVPDPLTRLARQIPEGLYLGTSSWSFPGWEGLVYDCRATKAHLAREGLEAYARHPLLRAVGIDRTYYAPISREELAVYADAVPADFRFLVKASSELTTPFRRGTGGVPAGPNELFLRPEYANDHVVGPFVEGLGAKAGPLVFQFPPQGARITREPPRFAEHLERFLSALPRGPRYAVELRDRALLTEDYVAALRAAHATHCLSVHPRMPPIEEQAKLADGGEGPLTVRWMLGTGLGYEQAIERYQPFSELVDEDPGQRSVLAEQCAAAVLTGREVVLVANNKAEGCAPLTAFRLAEAVSARMSTRKRATGNQREDDG
jgi:uncharacterized protein YecE (DUF72 family)